MNTHHINRIARSGILVSAISLMLLPLAASADTHISNIRFRMEMPAVVSPEQRIHIDFDYSTDETPSMFVYCVPLKDGAYVRYGSSSGSRFYTGTGSGDFWIRLRSGQQVDALIIYAIDDAQQILLDKVTVPVAIECADFGAVVTGLSAPQPAGFDHGEKLFVTLEYNVPIAGGVKLSVRPMTGGSTTPGYAASSLRLIEGAGTVDSSFLITSGVNVHVDALRIRFYALDGATILKDYYVPVDYYWSSAGIRPSVTSLNYATGTVNLLHDYVTSGEVRVSLSPESDGPVTSWATSVPPILSGSGTSSRWIRLEDPLYGRITGVRFRVLAYPSNDLLMNFVLPIPPVFRRSENYFTDVVISPATEGEIPCRQPVLAEFTWHSDELGEKIAYGYPVADSGSFPYSYKPYSYGGLAGPTGFASVYFHLTEPTPRHITGIRLVLRRKSDMATVAEETFPLDLWCMPPDPRFTGVACPAGTDVHVHARIVPCTTWRIESGDDLQTWPDVSDWMFCPDGYLDNLDVDALLPGGRRFYRIQTHEDVDRPNN